MYASVSGLCLLGALHFFAEMVNGASLSGPAEKVSSLKNLQYHDRLIFRDVGLAVALVEHLAKGVEGTRNLTSQQSERAFKLQEKLETHVVRKEERMKRGTTYQPYTADPYDLGPLNQCSTPKVSQCSYSSDVTVPEYQARRIPDIFDYLYSIVADHLKQTPGLSDSQCLRDMISSFICDVLANPRCIGNDLVSYYSPTETECRSIISRVSSCSVTSQTLFVNGLCTSDFQADLDLPTGDYSLTRCVTPSVDVCDSAGTSPEWLANIQEGMFGNPLDSSNPMTVADGLTSVTCQTDYLRASCTIPTCTSDGKLRGTLTFDQCNVAYDCAVVIAGKRASSIPLVCEAYKTISDPSGSSAGLTVTRNILLSPLLLIIGTIFL